MAVKKIKLIARTISYKIAHLPLYWFIPLILLLSYIVVLPFAFIEDDFVREPHSLIFDFIVACIAAPLIETYLFQVLPIRVFMDYWIKNKNVAIFISALLFGISHLYSWNYIIWTFFVGLLFAWAYVIYKEVQGYKKAVLAIVVIHALRNFISLIIDHY